MTHYGDGGDISCTGNIKAGKAWPGVGCSGITAGLERGRSSTCGQTRGSGAGVQRQANMGKDPCPPERRGSCQALTTSPPAATQPHVSKGMEGSRSLGAGGPREGDGCEARSAEDVRGQGREPPAPALSKSNLPAA